MSSEDKNTTPIRRTSRIIKPSLKAQESIYTSTLKSGGFVARVSSSESEELTDSFDNSPEKPRYLHDNEAVKGDEIFTFQKQSDRVSARIVEAQKTPHVVRAKMKTKLKEVFEDSGSEYELSEEDESESGSECSSSDSDHVSKEKLCVDFDNVKVSSRGRKLKPNAKYTINSEEYFANTGGSKAKTSNNTLDKLQTPRLAQYELHKILEKKRHSSKHIAAIEQLTNGFKINFKKWLAILNQNFSLLLYGLGSKQSILSNFQKECLSDDSVLVVNGFFPGLSIKNVIDAIMQELLELTETPSNLNQAVELILNRIRSKKIHFYLLINNIESIKGAKAQNLLSLLANEKHIHLVATIDHINAPLIWDQNKLSRFNFTWWDVTSFLTYQHETEYEMSSMTQQNSALALSSLRNVFLSLTQNSKAIYMKLANHQMENSGQFYQGMAFKDLYMACREGFIVSSDLALKAQLNEFIDHKMIKTKRSVDDGTEYLMIPLANNLLQKFMDEHNQ